ncbi:hypothetical protein SESBI_37465 [Sesbania bispinosa]|nr:hypothetical protein SESBI_37465 [Sesbania bispinosa]
MQLLEEKDMIMSHDNGWSEYTMTELDREDAYLGGGVSHGGDCEGKGVASCSCRDGGVREACAPVCDDLIDGSCAVERDNDWICTMHFFFKKLHLVRALPVQDAQKKNPESASVSFFKGASVSFLSALN